MKIIPDLSALIYSCTITPTCPATFLNESQHTITIPDVNPVTKGHYLVISKQPYTDTVCTPDEILAEIIMQAKHAGNTLLKEESITGYNILTANGESAQQSVFHVHYHVIPRSNNDNLDLWFHTK